jgi:CubicO group peptidase (beta-lactamase class C family)
MACAGAIAVDGDGRPVLLAVASHEAAARPFSLTSAFRIASISKLVAALGFMTLVEEGALGLDDDVAYWLGPAFRHPAHPHRPLTPRRLLSHTSGLRNGEDFPVPAGLSLSARLERAAQEPGYGGWFAPIDAPPEWFSYSDTNLAALGQLIEAVSGRRFDLFMAERVFAADPPFAAGYNWSGVDQQTRALAWPGLRLFSGTWTPQVDAPPPPAPAIALYRGDASYAPNPDDLPLAQNGFVFAPHGGLRASLADLARLGQAMAGQAERVGLAHLAPAARRLHGRMGWRYRPEWPNGDSLEGFYQAFGPGPQRLIGTSGPGFGDAFFGSQSRDWVGHAGDAYGWMSGLWWNRRSKAVVAYAVNGMPETDRPQGLRSAMTSTEEAMIDLCLQALGSG